MGLSRKISLNTRRSGHSAMKLIHVDGLLFCAALWFYHRAEKGQRRGRLGQAKQHRGSAEWSKRAALPTQRGQRDVRLTRRGRRASLSGEAEAQNGNSG